MLTRFRTYLSQSIGGQVLGLFRILYSLFMAFEMIYYLKIDLVKNMFVLPSVNFKYDGLAWITPMSAPLMTALVGVLFLLSLLMATGVWFKWAARLFAIGNAYIFFQDTSLYNNHIYLYILLAWLLSCTHADQFYSMRKKTVTAIPRWEQFIFQLQMVIVYFYAGVIKLKYDWLVRQEPARTMCFGFDDHNWLAPLVKNEAAIYILTYGGLLLDLATPLLLWYRPMRKWAIYVFIGFHLFNSNLFDDIAFFPFVMLAGLVIFYEPLELKWLGSSVTAKPVSRKKVPAGSLQQQATGDAPLPSAFVKNLFIAYFVFQLVFPFRGFFLPNQMDWTTIGNRFAWRVKADTRGIDEMVFQVYYANGSVANVDVGTFINTHQIKMMVNDPRAVRELALAIKKAVIKQGGQVSAVKARIKLRYNGRPPQYFVDPESDLTKVEYSPFKKLDWVVPVSN
jgi:hypothetical protein